MTQRMRLYEEDNLYLAVRYAKIDAETQKVVWTVWQALVPLVQNGVFPALDDDGTQVTMPGNASNLYVQYAVFDEAPDTSIGSSISLTTTTTNPATK